jgi:hypothetical protein
MAIYDFDLITQAGSRLGGAYLDSDDGVLVNAHVLRLLGGFQT